MCPRHTDRTQTHFLLCAAALPAVVHGAQGGQQPQLQADPRSAQLGEVLLSLRHH